MKDAQIKVAIEEMLKKIGAKSYILIIDCGKDKTSKQAGNQMVCMLEGHQIELIHNVAISMEQSEDMQEVILKAAHLNMADKLLAFMRQQKHNLYSRMGKKRAES